MALEALAAWLREDQQRLEPCLAQPEALSRLTTLFKSHAHVPASEVLLRLLDSLLRILKYSKRVTVRTVT